MTAEQKQRALTALGMWHSSNDSSQREYQAAELMAALLQDLVDAPEALASTNPSQISSSAEPFGYFKAEPFGWTDCAETDDGAIALYTAPPAPAEANETVNMNRDCEHGQLARSCNICQLEQEVTMLRQEHAADTVEIAEMKARLADVEAINSIDARFCGRLALILECAILDPHGHFELACQLLEEYKAEWEKVNPSPPTFMGEPMPPERRARLLEMKAKRNEQEQSE